jgi:hypothetical protein
MSELLPLGPIWAMGAVVKVPVIVLLLIMSMAVLQFEVAAYFHHYVLLSTACAKMEVFLICEIINKKFW